MNPQNVLKHKKKYGAVMGFEVQKHFASVIAFRTVINPTFYVANVKSQLVFNSIPSQFQPPSIILTQVRLNVTLPHLSPCFQVLD